MQELNRFDASQELLKCPYCASALCLRVARHGCADFLRGLCGFYPWLCKTCLRRFCAWKRTYTAKAS